MTQEELESWLAQYVSKLLRARRTDVDIDMQFGQFGLDSIAAVGLSADLSELLGIELADDLAYRFGTIRLLAAHLATFPARNDP
jgi:acyl carrier protein